MEWVSASFFRFIVSCLGLVSIFVPVALSVRIWGSVSASIIFRIDVESGPPEALWFVVLFAGVFGVLYGMIVGIIVCGWQWSVLKKYVVGERLMWQCCNAVGWSIIWCFVLFAAFDDMVGLAALGGLEPAILLMLGLCAGVLYGTATGCNVAGLFQVEWARDAASEDSAGTRAEPG